MREVGCRKTEYFRLYAWRMRTERQAGFGPISIRTRRSNEILLSDLSTRNSRRRTTRSQRLPGQTRFTRRQQPIQCEAPRASWSSIVGTGVWQGGTTHGTVTLHTCTPSRSNCGKRSAFGNRGHIKTRSGVSGRCANFSRSAASLRRSWRRPRRGCGNMRSGVVSRRESG
jgi:hypothetical protein